MAIKIVVIRNFVSFIDAVGDRIAGTGDELSNKPMPHNPCATGAMNAAQAKKNWRQIVQSSDFNENWRDCLHFASFWVLVCGGGEWEYEISPDVRCVYLASANGSRALFVRTNDRANTTTCPPSLHRRKADFVVGGKMICRLQIWISSNFKWWMILRNIITLK